MRLSYRARLAVITGLALVVRVFLAFATKGHAFDLHSFTVVRRALLAHPLHVYSLVNTAVLYHWPYPSGFFPLVLLAGSVSSRAGLAFTSVIRLPAALADVTLAWVVQDFLRFKGASERASLGAALVILGGPLFVLVSGFNGQLDTAAILPAAAALSVWERVRGGHRAVLAGLLIGVGGAIKALPLLMVLALLPTCRSIREGAVLLMAAVALPLVLIAPFLVADAHAVVHAITYHGIAGQGGISLLAQPDLAGIWVGWPPPGAMTGISHALQGDLGTLLIAITLALAAFVALRFRARGVDAATLLWLTLFASSADFRPNYAIWGLPFFLMAGYLWLSVGLQAALFVPAILLLAYTPLNHGLRYAFIPLSALCWGAFLAGALLVAWKIARPGAQSTSIRCRTEARTMATTSTRSSSG